MQYNILFIQTYKCMKSVKNFSRRICINIMLILLSKLELLGTINIWDQIILCWLGDIVSCNVASLATSMPLPSR